MYRLPMRFLLLAELYAVLLFGLLGGGILWAFRPYTIVWYTLLFILGLLLLYVTVFYLPMYRENFIIEISDDVLKRCCGVWFPLKDAYPLHQISTVRLLQTPLFRLLSLSILIISAPGCRLLVFGLDTRDAKQIADMVINKR